MICHDTKESQNCIYCLNLLKNLNNLKAETLFHTRSNLHCIVCICVIGFKFLHFQSPHCNAKQHFNHKDKNAISVWREGQNVEKEMYFPVYLQ